MLNRIIDNHRHSKINHWNFTTNVLTGESAKLRKATITFIVSVCPSVPPYGTTLSPLDGCSCHLIYEYFFLFRKPVKTFQDSLKCGMNYRYFYMKTKRCFCPYLPQFFLEREMFQIQGVEKIKTHILCPVTFPRKLYRLWDNVEKNIVERGRATDDNTAHAHCVLEN
jgi:hypothetical protein